MKKMLFVVLVAVFGLSVTNVNAMTEEELKSKLTETYTINGYEWKAEASDIALVERYLDQYDVSETDADYIAAKIDEVIAALENGSTTSKGALTAAEKDLIVAAVNDISNATSVKATIKKGNLVVYNPDGTKFAEVTGLIKQTGENNVIYAVASLITVIGFLAIARKMKANA